MKHYTNAQHNAPGYSLLKMTAMVNIHRIRMTGIQTNRMGEHGKENRSQMAGST
jgi:hypothetical protein